MYTQEQFERLPKWAQSEILKLEMREDELNRKLREFEGKEETNTYIKDGLGKMPIINNCTVEFQTGEKGLNTVSVYVRGDGNIDVNTDSRLGHTMCIMPRASNTFYITFTK